MRKTYTQPDIVFESFALNENIATTSDTCTRNVTGAYNGSCGLHYGNRIIFTIAAAGCRTKVEDGSPMYDYLCYHVPTGENKLFNS